MDLEKHAVGDRVAYYRDPKLIGTIAQVHRHAQGHLVYAVAWPGGTAYWYTWSMLVPLEPTSRLARIVQ